jgi:hypothetical protein
MGREERHMSEETFFDWVTLKIVGSYTDADEVTQRLRLAAQHCHLLGGKTVCPPLAEGVAVLLQAVWIEPAESYLPTKGGRDEEPRRGISGTALLRIAAAAGVKWDRVERVDDRRTARYAEFEAEGHYLGMDLMKVRISGRRAIDLNDGSDEIAGDSPDKVANLRKTLLRAGETKAQLRAIRNAFGIRSMTANELNMPFIVPQLAFTGRSRNPAIQQMMAHAVFDAFDIAMPKLYGPEAPRMLTTQGDGEDWQDEAPPPKRFAPAPPPPPAPKAAPAPEPKVAPVPGEWVAPFGKCKGMSVSQIPDEDLDFFVEAISKSIADPAKEQYKDNNTRALGAVQAELAKRKKAAS